MGTKFTSAKSIRENSQTLSPMRYNLNSCSEKLKKTAVIEFRHHGCFPEIVFSYFVFPEQLSDKNL